MAKKQKRLGPSIKTQPQRQKAFEKRTSCLDFFGLSCGSGAGDKEVAGINRKRMITDMPMLLLFVSAFVAMYYILNYALTMGANPQHLLRPVDYKGRICGLSEGVEDAPYGAWPSRNKMTYNFKICVKSCEETGPREVSLLETTFPDDATIDGRMAYHEDSQEEGPDLLRQGYQSKTFVYYCVPTSLDSDEGGLVDFASAGETFNRGLGDIEASATTIGLSAVFALVFSFCYVWILKKFAGIMIWGSIFVIIAAGATLSYGLLYERQWFQGLLPQELGLDVAEPSLEDELNESEVEVVEIFAYIVFAITSIFFFVIFALRKRIRIAVEVIREASKAIGTMKTTLVFPLIPFVLACGFMGLWLYGTAIIMSVVDESPKATPVFITGTESANSFEGLLKSDDVVDGTINELEYNTTTVNGTTLSGLVDARPRLAAAYADYESARDSSSVFAALPEESPSVSNFFAGSTYKDHSFRDDMRWFMAAHLFILYWVLQFLVYFTYMSVAGAIAEWYFTPSLDSSGEDKPNLARYPICGAFKRTAMFHLGTVAFGALLIAICRITRTIVKYLEKHSKGQKNGAQKCLFKSLGCCIKCVQCCLDKLSKNAFVYSAIYGTAFCASSVQSFKLVWRNLVRLAAINFVGNYVIFIGKLFIAFITTLGFAGYFMQYVNPWDSSISSTTFPLLCIFLISYVIASLFMIVYETAMDTIFICFLIDEECNKKGGVMFASKNLRAVVGKYEHESRKMAAMAGVVEDDEYEVLDDDEPEPAPERRDRREPEPQRREPRRKKKKGYHRSYRYRDTVDDDFDRYTTYEDDYDDGYYEPRRHYKSMRSDRSRYR